MAQVTAEILEKMNSILERDGGRIVVLDEDLEKVVLRYDRGSADCQECVMTPESVQMIVTEALQREAPDVRVQFVDP